MKNIVIRLMNSSLTFLIYAIKVKIIFTLVEISQNFHLVSEMPVSLDKVQFYVNILENNISQILVKILILFYF